MRAEVTLPLATLYGFLLVLARVAGALVFVPLPGVNKGPQPARVMLALGFTVVLFPQWPKVEAIPLMGQLAGWLVLEAALGSLIGLAVSFLTEAFLMAAQVVGLPAGYAYASMVDPQTQADSGVLLVFAQLTAGMLFFALGLDREILRIFARSMETYPPGSLVLSPRAGEMVIRLGSGIFSTGLRLAMPALALLTLVDIALALLGRLNAQLQLLILSFPVKMMAAIGILAWIAVLFPRVYGSYGSETLGAVRVLIENGGY
jgi:flagellar biosynthetic protein FliR